MSLVGSLPVGVCTGWVGSYAESVDFGAEFLAQNRAFGDTVLSVDPDTPVPTCPGWTAKQLFRHVGRGNRWAAQMVAEHATEPADPASVPDGRPPADLDGSRAWLDDGARLLVDAVDAAVAQAHAEGADCSVWTFLGPRPSPWWIRRRLHEVLVHRADAAIAGGFTFDVRPELAADCIDEWLELAVAVNSDFAGRVALLATDEELGGRGDWTIGGGTWTRSSGVADVTLTGTVRDLLLVTTRRCTPAEAGVDVSGDEELLATWLDGMKF